MERAFVQWGLPRRLRFDNGLPFANQVDLALPTALAVWLVSLGIEVVFNKPYSPQQNGSVECTQRISSRWANPQKCQSTAELQRRLNHAAHTHLKIYRIRAQKDVTRKELFPTLFNNPRKYDPKRIDLQRVKAYLVRFSWVRKVATNGTMSLFSQQFSVGAKYKNQTVLVSLNPQKLCWQISLNNGTIIKTMPPLNLTMKGIADLTIFSKNFTT